MKVPRRPKLSSDLVAEGKPSLDGGIQAPRNYKPPNPGISPGQVAIGVGKGYPAQGNVGVGPGHPVPSPGGGSGGPGSDPGLPPPSSMETDEARRQAQANLGISQNKFNTGLYSAAMRYGDPEVMSRIASETGGDNVVSPFSKLSQLQRQEDLAKRNLAVSHNARNTFFSGANIRDIGNLENEAGYQRAQALDAYQQAEASYRAALAKAIETYNEAINSADIADIHAAEQTTAEAKGTVGGKKKGPDQGKGGGKGKGEGEGTKPHLGMGAGHLAKGKRKAAIADQKLVPYRKRKK